MYNTKKAKLEFMDFDIAKIEAAHDILTDRYGMDFNNPTLKRLRELTSRMYKQLNK